MSLRNLQCTAVLVPLPSHSRRTSKFVRLIKGLLITFQPWQHANCGRTDFPVTTLHEHLATWASTAQDQQPVADTIAVIATAAAQLTTVIAQGPLAGDLGRILGASNDGDGQKALDV